MYIFILLFFFQIAFLCSILAKIVLVTFTGLEWKVTRKEWKLKKLTRTILARIYVLIYDGPYPVSHSPTTLSGHVEYGKPGIFTTSGRDNELIAAELVGS